jgi:hypothetical protein
MFLRVKRFFENRRLAKTPGFKTLVLVSIDTIQNNFEFGPGLTLPVGARKWPFLGQVESLFYRTPGNYLRFFTMNQSRGVETRKK